MKKLFIAASALLLTTGTFAQTKMGGTDVRFGLKAGVNLSRVHYTNDYSNLNDYVKDNVGFNVTGYGDFGIANNFFIQPGITLQNKGTNIELKDENNQAINTMKSSLMSIDVPVNAVLRIPTGDAGAVQISAGPYIGFNISGKEKIELNTGAATGSTERDYKFGSSTDDDVSSIDYGANFGLGYRLNSGLTLGANYGLGFANMVPKDKVTNNSKGTNRILGFSVGYSF